MPTKAQHTSAYKPLPALLTSIRTEAQMTQRALGKKLKKPQSWIHNCETGNRRVDLAEFCRWCFACEADPFIALKRFLRDR